MKKAYFSIIFTSLLLSACIHDYTPPPPKNTEDTAVLTLAKAANSISDSLLTLEAMKKAEDPNYIKVLQIPSNPRLNVMAIVDWHGPIAALVERIAGSSDYHFEELGKRPKIPIIVSIHKRATLAEILRDADIQAGKRADVVVIGNHAFAHYDKSGNIIGAKKYGWKGKPSGVIQVRYHANG